MEVTLCGFFCKVGWSKSSVRSYRLEESAKRDLWFWGWFFLCLCILQRSHHVFRRGHASENRKKQRNSLKFAVCFRNSFISKRLIWLSHIVVTWPPRTENLARNYAKHTDFGEKTRLCFVLCRERRKSRKSLFYRTQSYKRKLGTSLGRLDPREKSRWWA